MNLEKTLDHVCAPDLRDKLQVLVENGQSIQLDASAVETLSPMCLQILLAVKKQAIENGVEFQIVQRSETFNQTLEDLGFSQQF